jgi:hypothetical protein
MTRHQIQGLIIFGLALALTSGTLALAHRVHSTPPAAVELAVLVTTNAAATLMRFLLLRRWVFRKPERLRDSHPSNYNPHVSATQQEG